MDTRSQAVAETRILAVPAILVPRLDRDELAHPLEHPADGEAAAGGREAV